MQCFTLALVNDDEDYGGEVRKMMRRMRWRTVVVRKIHKTRMVMLKIRMVVVLVFVVLLLLLVLTVVVLLLVVVLVVVVVVVMVVLLVVGVLLVGQGCQTKN